MTDQTITAQKEPDGATTLSTMHEGQIVELVLLRPVGTLDFGRTFVAGGFSAAWVPLLREALRMAHDIAAAG